MYDDTARTFELIRVALVVPCLNEEGNLADTCASLGFGTGGDSTSEGAVLFLVDNGSTDSTVAVAEGIKANSREDTVFVGHEAERGYVPPRHRGNLMAKDLAASAGWNTDDLLILQADADTHYSEGYIKSMWSAAQASGPNVMIEACVDYPPAFKSEYPDYIRVCNETDAMYARLFARDLSDDDVVDDKVSGYRLGDYLRWGGHQREYTDTGEEIHAETARMYIRARGGGARRTRVEGALAHHSPRKVIEDPAHHLATAGFPREISWNERWRRLYQGPRDLRGLFAQPLHPDVATAIRVREKHLLALLGALPVHVDRTLGEISSVESAAFADAVLPLLPARTTSDLLSRPGVFLTDVFELMERHGDALIEKARKLTPPRA